MEQDKAGDIEPLVFEPGTDPAELVRHWVERPATRRLVEEFGGEWPAGPLREKVERLEAFSEVWDRRQGKSRLEILHLDDPRTEDAVLGLASELGLVEPAPPTGGTYDWILVLGGLATGCRPRVEYTADLLRNGVVRSARGICLLGSFRELHQDEMPVAREYAPGATTEVELLHAMAERELPGAGVWTTEHWGDRLDDPRRAALRAVRDSSPPVRIYAARSSAPEVRAANTADTYQQFAQDVGLKVGQRLLLVTTHIYSVYQHMDAVRTLSLPYSVAIETLGLPPARSPRRFSAAWYLQEVRSTIRSARMLLDAAET